MERIISILMRRDGLTHEEATEVVDNCISELMDAVEGTNFLSLEEVIEQELGLEPDYLDDLLSHILY